MVSPPRLPCRYLLCRNHFAESPRAVFGPRRLEQRPPAQDAGRFLLNAPSFECLMTVVIDGRTGFVVRGRNRAAPGPLKPSRGPIMPRGYGFFFGKVLARSSAGGGEAPRKCVRGAAPLPAP